MYMGICHNGGPRMWTRWPGYQPGWVVRPPGPSTAQRGQRRCKHADTAHSDTLLGYTAMCAIGT